MENHLYLYAAAALAIAALAAIFRRRPADPQAASGTSFDKFGEHVRLRDVYRVALLMEEKSRDFYLKMEARVGKPETRKLCAWLAGEEVTHRQFVQDQLDRWRPLGTHLTEWPKFLENVEQQGFFEPEPAPEATEDQLAAFAIRKEVKLQEFYAQFEAAFPQAWKSAKIHTLVEQERKHEQLLREQYPHLK